MKIKKLADGEKALADLTTEEKKELNKLESLVLEFENKQNPSLEEKYEAGILLEKLEAIIPTHDLEAIDHELDQASRSHKKSSKRSSQDFGGDSENSYEESRYSSSRGNSVGSSQSQQTSNLPHITLRTQERIVKSQDWLKVHQAKSQLDFVTSNQVMDVSQQIK